MLDTIACTRRTKTPAVSAARWYTGTRPSLYSSWVLVPKLISQGCCVLSIMHVATRAERDNTLLEGLGDKRTFQKWLARFDRYQRVRQGCFLQGCG